MRKIAHFGIAVGAMLAGCAMFQRDGGMAPMAANCTAGSCTFTVTVTGCGKAQIVPSADPIVVDAGYNGAMHWVLDAPSGWRFAANGIDIDQLGHNEFDSMSHSPGKVTWNNRHHHKGQHYKYTINVTRPGGGNCAYDPTIMN
jgi:hypothetical protein